MRSTRSPIRSKAACCVAISDAKSIAIAIITIINPLIGKLLSIVDMVFSMFFNQPEPWGTARLVFNDDGTLRIASNGDDGGQEIAHNLMVQLYGRLQADVNVYNQIDPQAKIGIIANRMGSLSYDEGDWSLADINPATGQPRAVHYDSNYIAVDPGQRQAQGYRSLTDQFIYSALSNMALAPDWEVQTARIQTSKGDPLAGLTETQRAQRTSQYLGEAHLTSAGNQGPDNQPGLWRTIALDLGGDGIQSLGLDESQVVFDVDGTGYLKQTAWIDGSNYETCTMPVSRNRSPRRRFLCAAIKRHQHRGCYPQSLSQFANVNQCNIA